MTVGGTQEQIEAAEEIARTDGITYSGSTFKELSASPTAEPTLVPTKDPTPAPVDDSSTRTGTSSSSNDDSSSMIIIIVVVVIVIIICAAGFGYVQYQHNKYTKEHVEKWTTHRVLEWLDEIELSQYAQNFKGKAVDGEMLLTLDDIELKEDLHIEDKLHRRKIVKFLQHLQDVEGEGTTTTTNFVASAAAATPGNVQAITSGSEAIDIEAFGADNTTGTSGNFDDEPIDIIDMEQANEERKEKGEGEGEGNGVEMPPLKLIKDGTLELDDSDGGRSSGLYRKEDGLYAEEGAATTTHTNPLSPSDMPGANFANFGPGGPGSPGDAEGTVASGAPGARRDPPKKKKPINILPVKRGEMAKESSLGPDLPDDSMDLVPPDSFGPALPDSNQEPMDSLGPALPDSSNEPAEGPGLQTATVSEIFLKREAKSPAKPISPADPTKAGSQDLDTPKSPITMPASADSSFFEIEEGSLPDSIANRQSTKAT